MIIKIVLTAILAVPLLYSIGRLINLFYFMYESRKDYTNSDTGPK
jgi:hypothetical protein